MTIALWFDAALAGLGLAAFFIAIFGKRSGNSADDEMASAFFFLISAALLAASAILFVVLTAVKAWT